jgi:tetratricopeptide (TPR) repeat protein
VLSLAVVAAAIGIVGFKGREAWSYRAELTRAERELASGQYASACARLEKLAAHWPGRANVEYSLGTCQAALGRIDAALSAWARVPRDSPLAARAILGRAKLALEHGRLAIAEESAELLLADTGEVGAQAASLADQVDLFTGRGRAIINRIERRWPVSPDQAGLLRLHWQLDSQPTAILAIRDALDRMAAEAPDDDRVWLGRANLAIATGRFDEADELLKKCAGRRPDDPDVFQSRLRWALDTGRVDLAATAASRVPVARMTSAEAAAVMARLAALSGDIAAEQAALERQVNLNPGASAAWDRLAELATRAGSAETAARYRARKTEIDRATDRYRSLIGRSAAGDRNREAELARTAEALGRWFEARGWWSLTVRHDPNDRDARAALDRLRRVEPPAAAGRFLAELIPAHLLTGTTVNAANRDVRPTVPQFRDDAQAAGLAFVYDNDPTPLCRLPETMGGGVAVLDYDGDGWLDVYAIGGGSLDDASAPLAGRQRDHLFRNKGDGEFEDVTERTGLAALPGGYGHGVAVGDYDNDGRPDLFVTRWRSYALYRNRADGTFADGTASAGLGGDRDWPTSAAFGDLDGDGDLDLYVCHYTDWDSQRTAPCPHPTHAGRNGYCVPRGLGAMPDHIFRNDDGVFVDVSGPSGVRGADRDGRGLGVVIADLDDDGRPDIFVANDMTANFLFRNLGGFRFEEIGELAGAASSGEGGYQAGMGVACGDLDGDGRIDVAVTNFFGESTAFYHNFGPGLFTNHTTAIGLAAPTRHVLGFGIAFLDVNNDGRLDVAQTNGHVMDYRPTMPYAMPGQLFLGDGPGRLVDASGRAGAPWLAPRLGRGLAAGDIDNDGRLDLLIVAEQQPLAYLHNQGPAGHFVTFQLQGRNSGTNRDGVGARVTLTAGGRRQVAVRIGGGSYLSASDGRLHFGLGQATRIDEAEVRWPSGHVDRYRQLGADSGYWLHEGKAQPRPLPGWAPRHAPVPAP